MNLQSIAIIATCVLSPLVIMWLTYRFKILRQIGNIILAYAVGCLLGLFGLIPNTPEVHELQSSIAAYAVPFAIPLMLYSSNVKAWAHLAPNFAKSLVAGLVACVAAVVIGFFIFKGNDADRFAKIGGMLTGLYTGGTTNIASIKVALGVDNATYLMVHTYSIVVSALYLLLIVVFGKRIFGLILRSFNAIDAEEVAKNEDADQDVSTHDDELFNGIFRRDILPGVGRAMLLTIGIIAVGFATKFLPFVSDDAFQAVFILTISLLAIVASFMRRVRRIKRTFEVGTYFILVFSVAVASQVSLDMFENMDYSFMLYTLVVTMGALVMHVVFNKMMRVDVDTTLVTSISLICSPPFVPVMAGALGNRAVIGPGIAVGLIGYAIGTYIGFAAALILTSLA